jgi:hypothetical protein
VTLEQKIAAGREEKARKLARALWEHWHDAERLGLGVRKLKSEPASFWRELADVIGVRHPSEETIALVMAKLEQATTQRRQRRTERQMRGEPV